MNYTPMATDAVSKRSFRRGQMYALAATAVWSTNFIIGRELRDTLTPGTIASFRALVAGVPMALWVLSTHGWPRDGRRQIGPIVALGLRGIVASQYMTYLALHLSLATNVIILNASSPLVTATIAVLVGAAPTRTADRKSKRLNS